MVAVTECLSVCKKLPGIFDHGHIVCRTSNGSYLLFDNNQQTFIQMDSITGEKSIIRTEQSKIARRSSYVGGQRLMAVKRSSQLFVLLLLTEKFTGKLFVVIYRYDENEFKILNEKNTGFESLAILSEDSLTALFSLSDEKIYIISSYSEQNREKWTTTVNIGKINIDDCGKLSCEHLSKQIKISGYLFLPFIHNETSYWFRRDDAQDRSLKLLQLSFSEVRPTLIASMDGFDDWEWIDFHSDNRYRTPLTVIGDHIYYYSFNSDQQFGTLLFFDFQNKIWKRVLILMDGHIIKCGPDISISQDGTLLLHGICNLDETCNEKAHLYNIDVRKIFQRESNAAEDNVTPEQKLMYGLETLYGRFVNLCLKWKNELNNKIQSGTEAVLNTCQKMFSEVREDYYLLKEEIERLRLQLDESQRLHQQQMHRQQQQHQQDRQQLLDEMQNMKEQIVNLEQLTNRQMAATIELTNHEVEQSLTSSYTPEESPVKEASHHTMSDVDKNVLTKNLSALCYDMNSVGVLIELETNGIFGDSDVQQIEAAKTSFERNARLVKMLRTRSPEALSLFIKALRDTNQEPLADLLEDYRHELNGEQKDATVLPRSTERYIERKAVEMHKSTSDNDKSSIGFLSRISSFIANRSLYESLTQANMIPFLFAAIMIVIAILALLIRQRIKSDD